MVNNNVALKKILQAPRWWAWAAASTLARLPGAMALLALILVGQQQYGSLALGTRLAGTFLLCAALASLWRGRVIDRGELRYGLRRETVTMVGLVGLLTALVLLTAPPWIVLIICGLTGAATSAIPGAFRAILPTVVPQHVLHSAYNVDAVLVEITYVSAPALVGLLVHLGGPLAPLLTMGAAGLVSCATAGLLPRLRPGDHSSTLPSSWRYPGTLTVYGLALLLTISFGVGVAGVSAKIVDLGGNAGTVGLFLALYALGSVLGGTIVSVRGGQAAAPARQAIALMLLWGLLLLPLALVTSNPLIAGTLLLAGLPIAPLQGLANSRLNRLVPPGRQTEAFALFTAMLSAGVGLGSNLGGSLLDIGGPGLALYSAALLPVFTGLGLAAILLARPALLSVRPATEKAKGDQR